MEIFGELVERWIEEFGRAVEMFTGEKARISALGEPMAWTSAEIEQRTWWRQSVQAEDLFSFWAGASESMWNALGEGSEAQSSFFEMLSQANQGTAAVLSAGFPKPWQCQEGTPETPALEAETLSVRIKVTFRTVEAGVLVLAVEKKVLILLNANTKPEASSDPEPMNAVSASPAMLSRLMDLQLPVSVLLGRANITIKDALKLASGSVVELDRRVGDPVEIVVHGTVVARGEVVSVRGNYGVRIKEVISRQDRMALHSAA